MQETQCSFVRRVNSRSFRWFGPPVLKHRYMIIGPGVRWASMKARLKNPFFSESGSGEVNLERTKSFEEGGCSALPWGRPNIHKISNRTTQSSISIHIYGGNCIEEGPNLRQLYELST